MSQFNYLWIMMFFGIVVYLMECDCGVIGGGGCGGCGGGGGGCSCGGGGGGGGGCGGCGGG
ncbi:MAG: hypothetical protein WBM35_03985 [Candidatus Electrothrix sp.]